ncbi:endonuclease-reverse transcriptase [Elysia marginata]|uniref:Endonuclease-reverse transcriptase n=1 Tax=Elysia marginata TaxID=1093978 RepID=A0AAV4J1R2_9GAST|nr:endonuclease-reverse transcriptase [Elysia marginata]
MWRILLRQMDVQPEAASDIVKAITALHNFIIIHEPSRETTQRTTTSQQEPIVEQAPQLKFKPPTGPSPAETRFHESDFTAAVKSKSSRAGREKGRRKRGRPKTTWRRTAEAEAATMGQSWGTLRTLAQDREKWRDFVAALVAHGKKGSE